MKSAMQGERGITLIELLAALLITGFIVVMASRIFISGNRQYLLRSSESQRLEELYRLKSVVQGVLKKEVEACASGRLSLEDQGGAKDAEEMLKGHFPNLGGAFFNCSELSSDRLSLVEWKDWFQPRLVEYRIMLRQKRTVDTLVGSWVK